MEDTRGLPGHPGWIPSPPPRDWGTHMMKAVTPMAQMSVCGTAPWPSRSSGAGGDTGERTGERLGVRNAMGREAGPGGGALPPGPPFPPGQVGICSQRTHGLHVILEPLGGQDPLLREALGVAQVDDLE